MVNLLGVFKPTPAICLIAGEVMGSGFFGGGSLLPMGFCSPCGIVINRKSRRRGGRPPVPGKLDPGIRKAVERLQAEGIETFESCEGGSGHAFPEPTIRFYGTPEAGWP